MRFGRSLTATLRAVLALFLVLSTGVMLFATYRVTAAVRTLADRSLESTALALAASVENALRLGKGPEEVRAILADRVVAYALIAGGGGEILFHTNADLVGGRLADPAAASWFRTETAAGRRTVLGTGMPAYEYGYPLHARSEPTRLLRLVLHTTRVDPIVSEARGLWGVAAGLSALLWALGLGLERVLSRQVRLRDDLAKAERLALIGQMTSSLAHEIRNALGSVKGFAQWVDEKTETGDPRKIGLDAVLRGSDRIDGLVEDLLLYAREERYEIEQVPAAEALRQAWGVEAGGRELGVEIDAGDEVVLADRERLHRALVNGIRNALQATEGAGPVALRTRAEGGRVALRIEDSGPGFPEEIRDRIFTPFFTTKADGTGLGLAYSRKVIEGMGGTVDLTNRPGGGAVLVIRLPKGGG